MAQATIKDYFPSKKIQEKRKNVNTKRSLESLNAPQSKRRRVTKVLTNQREDKRESSRDIRPILSSSTSINSYGAHDGPVNEAAPASVKSSATNLHCFETLPTTSSPLRRGAECVRLALEKKTASPVSLGRNGKEKAPMLSETRRKLFCSEVTTDHVTTVKHTTDDNVPVVKKTDNESDNSSTDLPVNQTINGITPLKNKTTRSTKQTPKLKPFASLVYDSPTKSDK